MGNILLAGASLGPTILLIVALTHSETVEPSLVAALIVSLTRIFLIVNSLSALVYRVLDYSSLHARVKVLLDAGTRMAHSMSESVASPINVSINGIPVRDVLALKDVVATSTRGRFTITGDNGSGKSAALLALKKEYGATCFLLPTDHSELAWGNDCRSLSTGQRLVEHLKEILKLESIRYILLDEWDANLDTSNTQQIDSILSDLSAQKIIIEVRHKKDQA
jgi:ABC-type transport system involved in cytochrome bd biosynthesis fused ATPase/permease subunit